MPCVAPGLCVHPIIVMFVRQCSSAIHVCVCARSHALFVVAVSAWDFEFSGVLAARTVAMSGRTNMPSTCDGRPLVGYATKVPVLRMSKTADSLIDEAKLTREQVQQIVDKMIKYPDMVGKLHNIFFSQNFAVPTDAWAGAKVSWQGPYSTLGKVSAGWLASWLLSRHKGSGLTQEILTAIDKRDPDQIMLLVAFETQLSPLVILPKSLSNEADLTSKCLALRGNAMGSRTAQLIQKGAIVRGHIDFMQGGCYELIFAEEGDDAVSIRHVSGLEVKVPPHIRITRAFNLLDNHSDAEARVSFDSSLEHNLYKFFIGNAFADDIKNDKRGTKVLQKLAKDLSDAKADEEQRQVDLVRGEPEILKSGQDERKKVASDRARQAMERKRQERVVKRKFSLAAGRAAGSAASGPKPKIAKATATA